MEQDQIFPVEYFAVDAAHFVHDGKEDDEGILKLWKTWSAHVMAEARSKGGVETNGEIKISHFNEVIKELKPRFAKFPDAFITISWKEWTNALKTEATKAIAIYKEKLKAEKEAEKESKKLKAKEDKEEAALLSKIKGKEKIDGMEVDVGSSGAPKSAKATPKSKVIEAPGEVTTKRTTRVTRVGNSSTVEIVLRVPRKGLIELLSQEMEGLGLK